MMRPLKIVHIHSDKKFIDEGNCFEANEFNNLIILISDDEEHKKVVYKQNTIIISSIKLKIENILFHCEDADLVLLYDLDFVKSKIAISLPKNIKIGWRFFGYELYGKNRRSYLSKQTKKLLVDKKSNLYRFKSLIKKYREELKLITFPKLLLDKTIRKAISRCDFFFGIMEIEYIHLKTVWGRLPKFISWPILKYNENNAYSLEQKSISKTILIGNSKNNWNNHIEILDIIKNNTSHNYKFILPFNYGDKGEYESYIKQQVTANDNIQLIESFIEIKEFINFFKSASAAIYNSYRQLALGNIVLALEYGVKLYLNSKNPTFEWLKTLGFEVFDINSFDDDLINGELILNEEQANKNIEKYNLLTSKNEVKLFQEAIIQRIA